MAKIERSTDTLRLTYADEAHAYYLNGVRAKSVTAVAKIPTDTFGLDQWKLRQVAIGMAMREHLLQNVAIDLDNKEVIQKACDEAMNIADTRKAADRGTQMHRVLQLVLLDQHELLLTDQQRRDALVLRRTLDRYRLTPYQDMTEQFVAWPHYRVTGRFDCLLEHPDGRIVLTDLKSGQGAITYPHSVAIQLALYARAPHVSAVIEGIGDKLTVTQWREMPERLDRRNGYVLLVPPDAEVGTLFEVDIQHGWQAAAWALEIVNWRKAKGYGKEAVREVPEFEIGRDDTTPYALMAIRGAGSVDELRAIWRTHAETGELTAGLKAAMEARSRELQGVA